MKVLGPSVKIPQTNQQQVSGIQIESWFFFGSCLCKASPQSLR